MIVVLTAGFFGCNSGNGHGVQKVVRGPFHIKVHAIGQLKSSASLLIGCPSVRRTWRYTIAYMAPEGKEVKADERVLGFDTKELMEKFQVKQSELATAKQELERTRLVEQETLDGLVLQTTETRVNLEKSRQMASQPEDLSARNDVKKAKMDLELAELQAELTHSRMLNQKSGMGTRIRALESKIKQLENEVSDLQSSIERMQVKAPKPGMVVYAQDWRGRKKAVGDNTWMGDTIIELPDLSKMEVAAVVPEPQAGKVKEGLTAEIRLDSNPDKLYSGKVKSLGRIFRTKSDDQPSVVFDAVIEISDPDPQLMRPGMAAGADIIISSKQDVVQIPESAIIYDEKGMFVKKKSFTGSSRVPVTIGVRSGGMVEVLSGLQEGDRILVKAGQNGEKE